GGMVRIRRAGRLDAVPLDRFRLLGLGALGRPALRRAAPGGALLGEPLSGGIRRSAGRRAGDGAESDAVGLPAADLGGGCESRKLLGPARGDLRRRSLGAAEPLALVCEARRS